MQPADPEQAVKDVGRRIAELRLALGLTQEAFADRVGVSVKYIQRVEQGLENLTVYSLVKLANALATPAVELLRPPTSPKPKIGRPRKQGAE